MLSALRHNRIINPAIMIVAAIVVLRALESFGNHTLLSALGWFIVAFIVVLYGEDVQLAVDDAVQPRHRLSNAVLFALNWAAVVYLVIVNPAGGVLVPVVMAIPAFVGAYLWLRNLSDPETKRLLRNRRRTPRHGLSRIIPV